jgi:DNA-binding transcriptional regulator YiaG
MTGRRAEKRIAMTAKRAFKSEAFADIHDAVRAMHAAGTVDKATMKTFDDTCRTHAPMPSGPAPKP